MSFFLFSERNGSRFGLFLTFVVIATVVGACIAGYMFYKYRLRVNICRSNACPCSFNSILINSLPRTHTCLFSCICSHTWIQRSWPLCLSTCHLTITKTMKFNMKLNPCGIVQPYKVFNI